MDMVQPEQPTPPRSREMPEPLSSLSNELYQEHGAKLAVIDRTLPGVDYMADATRHPDGYVVLTYKNTQRRHTLHFLTGGCYQFCRLLRSPEEDRHVAVPHWGGRLPEELEEDLRDSLPPYIEGKKVERLSRVLYQGLLRQLTQLPTQIRIERELRQQYAMHQETQDAYLIDLANDTVWLVDEIAEECAESRVDQVSVAMSITASEEAAVTGDNPVSDFGPYRRMVGDMVDRLREATEGTPPGIAGDRDAIDTWADILGMRGWYDWAQVRDA